MLFFQRSISARWKVGVCADACWTCVRNIFMWDGWWWPKCREMIAWDVRRSFDSTHSTNYDSSTNYRLVHPVNVIFRRCCPRCFPLETCNFFFYAPVAQFSLFHCSISRLCLFMFFSIVGKSRYYFYYVWWIKIHDFPIKKRNIWILIFSFSSSLLLISMYLFDSKMWQNTQDGQVDSGSRLVSTVFSSRRWWTLSRP